MHAPLLRFRPVVSVLSLVAMIVGCAAPVEPLRDAARADDAESGADAQVDARDSSLLEDGARMVDAGADVGADAGADAIAEPGDGASRESGVDATGGDALYELDGSTGVFDALPGDGPGSFDDGPRGFEGGPADAPDGAVSPCTHGEGIVAATSELEIDAMRTVDRWIVTSGGRLDFALPATLAVGTGARDGWLVVTATAPIASEWLGVQYQGPQPPGAVESYSVDSDGAPSTLWMLVQDAQGRFFRRDGEPTTMRDRVRTRFGVAAELARWTHVARAGDDHPSEPALPLRPLVVGYSRPVVGTPVYLSRFTARTAVAPIERIALTNALPRGGRMFARDTEFSLPLRAEYRALGGLGTVAGTLVVTAVGPDGVAQEFVGPSVSLFDGVPNTFNVPMRLAREGSYDVVASVRCGRVATPYRTRVAVAREDSPRMPGLGAPQYGLNAGWEDEPSLRNVRGPGVRAARVWMYGYQLEPFEGLFAWSEPTSESHGEGTALRFINGLAPLEAADSPSLSSPAATGELTVAFDMQIGAPREGEDRWTWLVSKFERSGAYRRELLVYYDRLSRNINLSLSKPDTSPPAFEDRGYNVPASVDVSQWHHVAFVFRRADNSLAVYFDGALAATQHFTMPDLLVDTTAPLQLGSSLTGALDNVAIYSRALGSREIASLMRGAPPTDGAIALYDFERRTEGAFADGSPHANTLYMGRARADVQVDRLRAEGIAPYGNLHSIATWMAPSGASGTGTGTDSIGGACARVPANLRTACGPDLAKWRPYVREVVRHFAGRITEWSVWNEPNGETFWKPTPDPRAYAELLCATYEEVHRVCPTCRVAGFELAGPIAGAGLEFLRTAVSAIPPGQRCMDALAIHPYRGPASPEDVSLLGDITSTRSIVGDLPLWFGEWGWTTVAEAGAPTERAQADWTARSMILGAGAGVERQYLFDDIDWGPEWTWGEQHFGLLDYDVTPKPAFYAYHATAERLDGARVGALSARTGAVNARTFVYDVERDAQHTVALWSADTRALVALEVSGPVPTSARDALGTDAPVLARDGVAIVSAGSTPVFLAPLAARPRVLSEALAFDPPEVRVARGASAPWRIELRNPTATALTASLAWSLPAGVHIEPATYSTTIAPMSSTLVSLVVRADADARAGLTDASLGLLLDRVRFAFAPSLVVTRTTAPASDVTQFSFDDDPTGARLIDRSGNRYDGTLTGTAQLIAGRSACAWQFNTAGAGSVTVPDRGRGPLDARDELTVAFWFSGLRPTSDYQNLVYKWGPSGRALGVFIGQNSDTLCFTATHEGEPASHEDRCVGFDQWADGWHHFAAVFDDLRRELAIYVDGVPRGRFTSTLGPLVTNDDPLVMMHNVRGALDQLHVMARALTPSEVAALVAAERAASSSCSVVGTGAR